METPFESFASTHFRPWEHYVPFKEDSSDFEERLAWCQANDAECRAMAVRARIVCQKLADATLRQEANRQVIAEIRRRM